MALAILFLRSKDYKVFVLYWSDSTLVYAYLAVHKANFKAQLTSVRKLKEEVQTMLFGGHDSFHQLQRKDKAANLRTKQEKRCSKGKKNKHIFITIQLSYIFW